MITVEWMAAAPDGAVRAGIHRVLAAVVEVGGAVGYLAVPSRADADGWLDTLAEPIRVGRAGLALCLVDGRVEAFGLWSSEQPGPLGHTAWLGRIMAHPEARGLGLGRLVMDALIAGAGAAGAEVLKLGVRGNNHGAIALYESCGFAVCGVVPNGIAVGDLRFDEVMMARQLSLPDGAVLRGRSAGGVGGSDRREAGPA